MRKVGAYAVVVVALVFCSAARAAPAPGRWSGSGGGGQAEFVVSRVGGTDVLSDLVVRCPGGGGVVEEFPNAWFGSGSGHDRRAQAAIGTDGTIHGRYRRPGVTYETGRYDGVLSGRLAARGGTVTVDARAATLEPSPTGGCDLRDLHVAPSGDSLRVDGQYRLTGPAGTDGFVYVYGRGALLDFDADSFGTPVGVPDPDFPEITCGEMGMMAAIPDTAVFPSGSGTFSSAAAGPLGVATFGGHFFSAGRATGVYAATTPLDASCSGGGAFGVTLHRRAPALTPASPLPGALPPGPSHRRHRRVPRTVRYVALGDSFSSGEGVPPYERGTNSLHDRCHRSTRAYARLVSRPGAVPKFRLRSSFYACSGAVTANVLRTRRYGERPQIDRPLLRRARLVTISIGGNDAGFSKVVAACSRLARTRCYRGASAATVLQGIRNLRSTLASTYEAIHKRTGLKAKVVVLGYPNLFPARSCRKLRTLFSVPSQAFMRRAGGVLDQTIQQAAEDAGVRFVDVRPTFADHELCARQEWVDFLVRPHIRRVSAVTGSFHPNARGQSAYARVLKGVLEQELP